MSKLLPAQAFRKLVRLYKDMQSTYTHYAAKIQLSCIDCSKNCCTSYFQHHTYIEWAYLHAGLKTLPQEKQDLYLNRAEQAVQQSNNSLLRGERPSVMCPLNDDGLCGMYTHRFMICRLHGVPNCLRYPDGRIVEFPGCFQSQNICAAMSEKPVLDRTSLYIRLMELEIQFVGTKLGQLPKVDLTLAEMLLAGKPDI